MSDVSQHILATDVTAFQEAYRRYFDVELDADTARRKLTQLVRFTELMCKPAACATAEGRYGTEN